MPTLEFTLMVGCPLKCTFCPQDGLRARYGQNEKYMSFATFRTILAKVPKHVRVDFSGMAEPWANPSTTDMLRHTLLAGYTVGIYTTLYDIPPAEAETIIGLLRAHAPQIEVICLHLPDRNANMRGWRFNADYEATLRAFIGLGLARTLPRFEIMTMDPEGQIHPDLNHIGIRLGQWLGHTRAGNVTEADVAGQPLEAMPRHDSAVTCSFTPYYDQNVCLPNGDVVLCCMDYSLKHKIGNLIEQDYYEMFAGPGLGQLIGENMKPAFSGLSLCKSCNRAARHVPGPSRQFWQGAA